MTVSTGTMTPRERWLAAIDFQEVDRLPFWPKINGTYIKSQEAKYRDWSYQEMADFIDCEYQGWADACLKETHKKGDFEQTGGWEQGYFKRKYTAPSGAVLTSTDTHDPASGSFHPTEFPIKTRDDLLVLADYYNDCVVEPDLEALETLRKLQADEPPRYIVTTGLGESPLMFTIEHMAGVAEAHMFLMMYPEETEELFAAIHRYLCDKCRAVAEMDHPADAFYFIENTSTTLISPDQYRQYCLPQIQEYGEILKSGGKRQALHMCGKLKLILPDLAKTPAVLFEAFTSPPVGDTTLLDGREGCPEKCIVGGTNAAIWTRPADEIIAQLEKDLDALPHHRGIVTSSGGMMPPLASPETIKAVSDSIHNYPAKF